MPKSVTMNMASPTATWGVGGSGEAIKFEVNLSEMSEMFEWNE